MTETTTYCEACDKPAHEKRSECHFYHLSWRGKITKAWSNFSTGGGGYPIAIRVIGNNLIEASDADTLNRYSVPGSGLMSIAQDAQRRYHAGESS